MKNYCHSNVSNFEICAFFFNQLEQIVERRLERSIIFEDDIHFVSNFRNKMADLVSEADRAVPDWDLM